MTDNHRRAISPLRRRMIDDLTIRGFTSSTQKGYIRAVEDFTAFLGRSPDQAGGEDLRRYQLHMRSAGASAGSMNRSVSALRFFFTVTLDRNAVAEVLTTVREPRKLPVVLSPEEVARRRQVGCQGGGQRLRGIIQARAAWGNGGPPYPSTSSMVSGPLGTTQMNSKGSPPSSAV